MAHEYCVTVIVRTYTDCVRDIKSAVVSALTKSPEIYSVVDINVDHREDEL